MRRHLLLLVAAIAAAALPPLAAGAAEQDTEHEAELRVSSGFSTEDEPHRQGGCHTPGDRDHIYFQIADTHRGMVIAVEDAVVEFDDGRRARVGVWRTSSSGLVRIEGPFQIGFLGSVVWLPLEQLDIGDSQTLTARLTISSDAGHSGLELVSKTVPICEELDEGSANTHGRGQGGGFPTLLVWAVLPLVGFLMFWPLTKRLFGVK